MYFDLCLTIYQTIPRFNNPNSFFSISNDVFDYFSNKPYFLSRI